MASTYFHRTRVRRAARKAATGEQINLVPLVDILTSIVFFSLLTYAGSALAALTSFDLTLPPTVVERPDQIAKLQEKDVLNLLLAVRVYDDHMEIEHSAEGGYHRKIEGITGVSLDTLETEMAAIRRKYPQNRDVLVVPADGISYDAIVGILERLKRARYSAIALGTRARKP
ncbi:MAG: biopolymer transporter ExbD [Gemmatimonadota bacterium]|nr:biopolymer transporter ExbD [Gemmatimonadota bacterium]